MITRTNILRGRSWLRTTVTLTVVIAFCTACYFAIWRYHLKRFDAVAPGVLYRTAQPTEWGMRYLVKDCGVKTIISVRRDDAALKTWIDFDEPDGPLESVCARSLGARFLHWQMGGEAYWPWFSPEYFEEYFAILDNPENLPVAIHCVGGRHRTGTLAALYRLEYDRWTVIDTLEEMYSYDFGIPVPIQEHNLRTYYPRFRPSPEDWQRLRSAFAGGSELRDYEALVLRLRKRGLPQDAAVLLGLLELRDPAALALAERLIDAEEHPLAVPALEAAEHCLAQPRQPRHAWASAAALVADWGTPRQQQALLEILENEPRQGTPSPRYQAVVAGVTNRYSPNRAPYLAPLLKDTRQRPEADAAWYQYADTAAARLSSIVNEAFLLVIPADRSTWDQAQQAAQAWLAENPEICQLRRFDRELFDRFHQTVEEVEDKDDYRD